jgi:isopentenyldiphosphate isomerase
VDWIDVKGKVIGEIDKNFAHQHGLLHPAGHVFVFDAQKRMILQYRTHKKKIYPQHWDTAVGGHIHAGGDILTNTKREAREELGIKTQLHYLGHADAEDHEKNSKGTFHHHERVHYYYTLLPHGYKVHPNEEFDDIAYLSLEELPSFIKKKKFTATFKAGWKKFGKKLAGHLK